MSRPIDAASLGGARRGLARVGIALSLLACSQSAGVGAAPLGTRLAAAQLHPAGDDGPAARGRASRVPALTLLDRHESLELERSAAEIVDFHAPSRRVFVVDSGEARVRVLRLAEGGFRGGERTLDPVRDMLASEDGTRDFEAREVTSLAVGGDVLAVAVPAARNDRRGRVALYAAGELRYLGSVDVGFVPDMLTFTPDARRILVANEGEQVRGRDERIVADPEGSVSIIDLRAGLDRPTVSHARFDGFDARVEEYRAAGVRVARLGDRFFESGDAAVRLSLDLEPEYIAVAADGRHAWVSLQENDAVALLDIESGSFVDIFPLGVKDFARGQPSLARVSLSAPAGSGAACTAAPAGLWFEPSESRPGHEVTYVLRGGSIERHVLGPNGATLGAVVDLDRRLGRGSIGLARDRRDGAFWLGDAERPRLYRVGGDGRLSAEVPLPAAADARLAALGFDPIERHLLAFLEPASVDGQTERWARLLVIDADPARPRFGEPLAEHLYPLGGTNGQGRMHAVAASSVEKGQLLVLERSEDGETDELFRVDLTGAGDVRSLPRGTQPLDAPALRELTSRHVLSPVHKWASVALSNRGRPGPTAGLAALGGGRVAVLGGAGLELLPGVQENGESARAGVVLGILSFDAHFGLDASDRDGAVHVQRWPVLGEYMPDGIAALQLGGRDYFLTANEGDTRGYDARRLRDLELDPTRFPDAAALQSSASLGRLKVSVLDGDLDGDGDLDEVHAFGARSLSLWDRAGRLVFDTGSLFEEVTAAALAAAFNSNNDDNGSFDTRSDDRGPEPEGLAVAEIDGKAYAFVGLERVGGIVVLDVTDPARVEFVEYDNLRDFSANVERGAARDLGPEGLKFVSAADSPTGRAVLLVANEVSGTTTAYDVNL